MHNKTLKSNAVQKLETANPSINLSAKSMINAFITKRNKPNVIIVTGKVNRISNGFTNRFKTLNTTATISAPM